MTASSLDDFTLEYEHQESIEDFNLLKTIVAKLKRKKRQAQR